MSHMIRTRAANKVWGLLLSDRGDEIEEQDLLDIEAEAMALPPIRGVWQVDSGTELTPAIFEAAKDSLAAESMRPNPTVVVVEGIEFRWKPIAVEAPSSTAGPKDGYALLSDDFIEASELRAALTEIAEGTEPDRIGKYEYLRDWVHKVATAALALEPKK